MEYVLETVIGLEVHIGLCTDEKLFCRCQNRFGEPPNTLCCPVCLGKPGAQPVLNPQAVEFALRLGLALGCQINNPSFFDRKHYEYPDLPKGYQITQQRVPLCQDGTLRFEADGVEMAAEIERIHLEEDTGKTTFGPRGQPQIDFNRSGVPLVELVTRPQLRSAEQARAFLEELAALLRCLGVWDGKMQEGSLRTDVNVSLWLKGTPSPGPRCELKNLNGFGAVARAIHHEAERQAACLANGEALQPQTRRWDDKARKSTPMRTKSAEVDYRFQPETQLPPLRLEETWVESLRKTLPELPWQLRQRLEADYGLSAHLAQTLIKQEGMVSFFSCSCDLNLCKAKTLAKWMVGDVLRAAREMGTPWNETALTPKVLAELVAMVEGGEISGAAAKRLLPVLMADGGSPRTLAKHQGLLQVSHEEELAPLLEQVLLANSGALEDWRKGNKGAAEFLLGKAMAESRGRANPRLLRALLERRLAQFGRETVL